LLLRDFRFSDVSDLHDLARDERVGPSAGWKPHENETQTAQWLMAAVQDQNVWAIEDKDSRRLIGTIALQEDFTRPYSDVKALSFCLHPDFWGKGFMTEAVSYVLPYALLTLRLSRVTALHDPENHRSGRVIEKCGFIYEGTLREALYGFDGRRRDVCIYSLTVQDYLSLKEDGK